MDGLSVTDALAERAPVAVALGPVRRDRYHIPGHDQARVGDLRGNIHIALPWARFHETEPLLDSSDLAHKRLLLALLRRGACSAARSLGLIRGVRALRGLVSHLIAVMAADGRDRGADGSGALALTHLLGGQFPLGVAQWTRGALRTETGHVASAQLFPHVFLAAFRAVLAKAAGIPRTFNHFVLRPDVQELAVVFCALALCKKVAQRHALHVVLVEVFAQVALLALASEPVRTSIFDDLDPIPHTTLGQTADLVVVAPATARSIGSYASGISDDLLTAILVATRAPVVICPAMHTEMWEHPAVQDNLETLRSRGVTVVAPEEGRLAGGDLGSGRLAEPEKVFEVITELLTNGDFNGQRVVVTAGGTREAIDPVRYVGNRSTGKQGYAIAEAALARGAEVTLISTVDLEAPLGVDLVSVESASEMHEAVLERADADVIVMAAAVADFRPLDVSDSKIKSAH